MCEHDKSKWSFLIPAAGSGSRLGLGQKLQLDLNGEPLWQRAIRRAAKLSQEVIIAVPKEWVAYVASKAPNVVVIEGGVTRHDTIQKMLAATTHEYVLIHDLARPFASTALIKRVASAALETDAAGCLLPTDAPLASSDGELLIVVKEQHPISMLQSPLAFKKKTLEQAYAFSNNNIEPDQSTLELVKRSGQKVKLILGERDNFKITSADDYRVANLIAAVWDAADAA